MDAHVRETYADAPRIERDASGDDDASTSGDAGAIRLECGLFRIVETLAVDARARRVSRARDDRRLDRSFSISAMFGLTSDSSAETSASEREATGTTTTELLSASCARGTFASDDVNDDVGVANGYALACSTSGFGDWANGHDDGVEDGSDAAPRSAKVENFIAARDQRAPRTKRLAPWYEGSRAKITAMAHSMDGERLLCCTAAGGVYVVPIWELTRDAESSPAMRVLASRGTKPVSAVWWYRRLEPARADPVVAICVGADGEVRAWDVAKGSPLGACVVGAKCANAELARGKSSQFLVINGFDGEVWTLMLERMARVVKSSTVNKGKVETSMVAESLPDAAGTHDFAAHALTDEYGVREGRRVTLSVHEVHDGDDDSTTASVCVIAALIDRQKLELYDVDERKTPKSTHELPEHTVAVHVTDDLIFALVREPVFGEEDLTDLSSFTSSVRVLARRFSEDGSKSCTLQTFHVPRSVGVPKKFLPGPFPETYVGRRETLCGCMLLTSYGVYKLEPSGSIASSLRALMDDDEGKGVAAPASSDAWAPIERDAYGDKALSTGIDRDERLKLVARVLNEDHMPVFVEAARLELKRENFSRARDLFGKTGKPLKDFISLSLEVWEASQALSNFHRASVEAYGGQANMSWLKTAAAAHAHLHAWCEASNAVAFSGAADMGSTVVDQLKALNLNEERSPEQAVRELVRVIGEAIETTEDAGVQRDVACSVSAAIVALEAAKVVSTAVIASCAKDAYSDRVKSSFTVLLSSSSTVESLHMLGGITANSMRQAEQQGDGDVRPWESKPLVFWDSNVTFYVTATQTMEDLHDITTALGLKSDTSEVCEASPLELVYETMTTDELWSLVNMAHEARLLGVTGAREIQLTILLYLDDENAVVENISTMLEEEPGLFAWVVSKCLDKRKFAIAEEVAKTTKNFAIAAMCHIASLEVLTSEGDVSPSTLQAELELAMESYLPHVESNGARAKAIEDVVVCWMRHELALDELESNLRELLVSKGHAEAMQMVFERDLGFRFSGQFVLDVAKHRIAEDEVKYSTKGDVTIEILWDRIKGDVIHRMDAPECIETRPFDAMELDAISSDDASRCWVFTCGHRYGAVDLERAVEDAKGRLSILDLPVVSALLEKDYGMKKCAASCPMCVCYAVEHYVEQHRSAERTAAA